LPGLLSSSGKPTHHSSKTLKLTIMSVATVLNQKGSHVYAVTSKTTVLDALRLMSEKNIGALLVIDDEKLTGIMSERDYARKIILKGKTSQETLVEEIMTPNPYTINPTAKMDECMSLMSQYKIRHLPVVENDKVIGMISVGDVVTNIIVSQKEMINHLQNYISM
jgi:CBS domain-containing protein